MGELISERWSQYRRTRATLAQLATLSTPEAAFLGDQVLRNKQTFGATVDDLVIEGLQDKGLVVALPSKSVIPAYTIPDFVWRELQYRRKRAEQRKAPPRRSAAHHG